MDIEAKAKEYESNIGSQDYVPTEIEEAFVNGAEWMLEKAVNWLDLHGYESQYCSSSDGDEYIELDLLIEDFKKAMEE